MRSEVTPVTARGRCGATSARRRRRLGIGLIVLGVLELAACGGGGGGGGGLIGPQMAWPRPRRNDQNTAVGSASLVSNTGAAVLRYSHEAGGTTPSESPIVLGRNSTTYFGTNEGVLSLDSDGAERWFADRCDSTRVPIRAVAQISIALDARDIVISTVTSDTSEGGIFLLRESEVANDETAPECRFSFPVGSRSAALISIDGSDLSLTSLIAGSEGGRLLSITRNGLRRWSFPELAPFDGDVSSSPSSAIGGLVFTAPDGRLHSLGPAGRPRWSARIGDAYPNDEPIPSPTVFDNIFAVSAAGEVVAFSTAGTRLWSYAPDAPIAGAPAVSPITTTGGVFIGENVVFALDRQGTVYGIGSSSGALLRFCETDNRACRPSTCPGEAACMSQMRCSATTSRRCESVEDCPENETCTEQFRCMDDDDLTCTPDLCSGVETAGLCRREAKHPLANSPATFEYAPILSSDGFVVAATTDGRVCARRLDGSVPAGRCRESAAACTPDSCADGDSCCPLDQPDCQPGRCRMQPDRFCTRDTCPGGDTCDSPWVGGCVDLDEEFGSAAVAAPVLDSLGRILVATEKGLVRIQ